MAMTLTRTQQQSTGTETYSRVEAIADGALIVDGTLLDLRGTREGKSLYLRNDADLHRHRFVLVNRAPNGDWACTVSTTHTAASATSDSTLSSYPHAVIGNHGQAVQRTLAGSVTETDGLRRAFRVVHEQLLVWSGGLDSLSRFYPQSIVNAGHDWLYWAGHIAAYIVAHNSTYTWANKMDWAESVITGAADVSTPAEFYANTAAHTAPTSPRTWINPANGQKVNLANVIPLSANQAPTIAQLDNGGWIDSLTA